jgi:hypothetical protein
MTIRERLLRFFLWWAVIGFALWFGGTWFHMVVVVPLWSSSPPESVRAFFGGTDFNRTIWNFFGPPWMVVRNLPLILALITAWPLRVQRRLLLVAVACMTFGVLYTLFYIYPINNVLMTQAGGAGSDEQIREMVRQWIFADRLRFIVGIFGFVCLLRVFAMPPSSSLNSDLK